MLEDIVFLRLNHGYRYRSLSSTKMGGIGYGMLLRKIFRSKFD